MNAIARQEMEQDEIIAMNFDAGRVALEALRLAEIELNRRQSLIAEYRRMNGQHERLIGKLYAMARNKEARDELLLWDEFCDLVTAAHMAIHGPSD